MLDAFLAPYRGLALLPQPGLRPFLVLPLLLSTLVFIAVAWLAAGYFEALMAAILPGEGWVEGVTSNALLAGLLGGLLAVLEWLLWITFGGAYLVTVVFTFAIVANLLAAPFNAVLAARVERHLTGQGPPESSAGLAAEAAQAILGELRKLGYYLTRALPVAVLFFIPGLNLLAPVIWLLLGAWFLALEYFDYPMGNHGISFAEQRRYLAGQRWQALAFGLGASTLLMIPVVQLAAMPASVVGATARWVQRRPGFLDTPAGIP